MSTTSRNKGFTLLETLVALFLLVIVGAALYSSYFTVVRARERAEAGGEERRELRGTLDLLRREIASASYDSKNKKFRFVVEDRDIFGKPASTLEMTTIAPPRSGDQPGSDVMAVRYAMRDNGGKLLLYREARELYSGMKPVPYPQMENIQGFLVECFDGGKWVRSWDTELNQRLPERVRVTLSVKDGDKVVEFSAVSLPRMR